MKIGMEVGTIMFNGVGTIWHHIVGLLLVASIVGVAQPYAPVAETPISGAVNRHEGIIEIVPCDSTVRVRGNTQFRVGDEVLMIQMKGARISEVDDSTYGTIRDMNGAGCVEFLTIGSIANDRITFTTTWVHPYDAKGSIQLVSVPRYVDANITGTITTRPWNGSIGGVVVLRVDGNLRLSSNIDVSGMGFRGGTSSLPIGVCSATKWGSYYIYGDGGEKGDGIATVATTLALSSRGPYATGGGGGNGGNGGGAGGSNAGMGGHGGDANSLCQVYKLQGGYPGQAVDSLLLKQRLYLGGGGGGGHQNNLQGTPGAAGGGIVIIKANSITSNGGQIIARGLSVRDTVAWRNGQPQQPGDGAGGGGAGGSVLLDAVTANGLLTVDVRGGNGGVVGARYQPNGPGGGGGGGAIIATNVMPSVTGIINGGVPGTHISSETADDVRNSPWGATTGQPGRIVQGFIWKTPFRKTLAASGGGDICQGDSLTLTASDGFMFYVWSNGRTERSIRVGDPGTYSVVVTDSSGCRQTSGGMVVTIDPTLIDIQPLVEFGAVDFMRTYRRTLTIRSLDDDTIVVQNVPNSAAFSVVDPTIFPAAITPFGTLDVEIEFVANEQREYSESIIVDVVAPCAITGQVNLHARVNPVLLHVSMPDTTAQMGATNVSIPIIATLLPDTVFLPNTRLRLHVAVNSNTFAPTRVTRGVIVGDVIDKLLDIRTIIVEIDSLDIKALTSEVTRIVGTVLLSNTRSTLLDIVDVQWVRIRQTPILTIDDGSLTIEGVCFSDGRLVRILQGSPLIVGPNPVQNDLTLSTTLHANGIYTFTVADVQGRELLSHVEFVGQSGASHPFSLRVPASSWEQGMYVARLVSPLGTETVPFVISR
ncbi:MAG: hypothetical protein H7X70_04365 [Candidatus Kapabacteria bacterium]|nr:hypothetical protein [Candidatus Kapabacteria bacterium]